MGLVDGAEAMLGSRIVRFLSAFYGNRATSGAKKRRMQLLETMYLGGKKQMILIRCDTEEFLVGGGPDRIDTIVKISRSAIEDEPCQ
jgi:hypothetical protein